MNLWDQAKDHYGWLVSAAAAAAGFLARRSSGRPIRERLTASWIGRRLAVEKDNANLRADLTGMEESIARREATWQAERAEMEAYALRIQARANELTLLVESLRAVQGGASSIASVPHLPNSTPSDATSSPPLPKPST